MAIKKSELYSSLWKSCDELRGGMDASQYKDYVLVLLFVKYVSDRYAGDPNGTLEVPEGGGFKDMVALRGNKEIGDGLNKITARLAEANGLQGVINVADFNDEDRLGKGQDMVDRLSKLVGIFDSPALDFRGNSAEGDDLLGDAYEYLMRHFATESGKSKGQFYTPAEVSRVMALVVGVGRATSNSQSIYDPTCGSGSLLLKAHDEALARTGRDLTLYGQENDNATQALARMNMFLHGCPTAEIAKGNTLSNPQFKQGEVTLKTFDFVVANPPFSTKSWSNGLKPHEDVYKRFEYGIPPAKNGDYAFLLHVIASLKSTGTGAIVLPHGVLFRGNAEAHIRRELVRRGYIKGIIGLPPNLFYGTGIPACIVVLDKGGARERQGIFMIDASKGFRKDGNKNRLRAQDIHRIVDTFQNERDVPGYARMVPLEEIKDPKNDYNLNLPRYIDGAEPEDRQDIGGHLYGGIPDRDVDALSRYWEELPCTRAALFTAERPGYSRLAVPASEVKAAIFDNPEFSGFTEVIKSRYGAWADRFRQDLLDIAAGDRPKDLIETHSERLLRAFSGAPLMDGYDVYQRLMDYWAETMQDDVHLVAHAGWLGAAKPRKLSKDDKDQPDFKAGKDRFKSDLLPRALVVDAYHAQERDAIESLRAEVELLDQRLEEMRAEHGGEGGLLEEVTDDAGKISRAAVTKRLKETAGDAESQDERAMLSAYLKALDEHAEVKKALKAAEEALEKALANTYGKLTEEEIRRLAVDGKWLAALRAGMEAETDRVSQTLASRVRQLADRYAETLPTMAAEVGSLSAKVDKHLAAMGFTGAPVVTGGAAG